MLADGREILEGDFVEGGGGEFAFTVDTMRQSQSGDVGVSMVNWADDIVIRPSRD